MNFQLEIGQTFVHKVCVRLDSQSVAPYNSYHHRLCQVHVYDQMNMNIYDHMAMRWIWLDTWGEQRWREWRKDHPVHWSKGRDSASETRMQMHLTPTGNRCSAVCLFQPLAESMRYAPCGQRYAVRRNDVCGKCFWSASNSPVARRIAANQKVGRRPTTSIAIGAAASDICLLSGVDVPSPASSCDRTFRSARPHNPPNFEIFDWNWFPLSYQASPTFKWTFVPVVPGRIERPSKETSIIITLR